MNADSDYIDQRRCSVADLGVPAEAQPCHICHRPRNEPGEWYCSASHPWPVALRSNSFGGIWERRWDERCQQGQGKYRALFAALWDAYKWAVRL